MNLGVLLSPSGVLQCQIEPEKNAALWMFLAENGHLCSCQRMYQAPESLFFSIQSSDEDASLVLQDVLSSRMFCWAIFLPFVDIQDLFLLVDHFQTFLDLKHLACFVDLLQGSA